MDRVAAAKGTFPSSPDLDYYNLAHRYKRRIAQFEYLLRRARHYVPKDDVLRKEIEQLIGENNA